jgi:hypothetical protein
VPHVAQFAKMSQNGFMKNGLFPYKNCEAVVKYGYNAYLIFYV